MRTNLKSVFILILFLYLPVVCWSQIVGGFSDLVKMPAGRIAFSSDGNLHDTDDWAGTAMSLALIHYAGLENCFVHYDYNNHIGPNSNKSWEKQMHKAAKEGAKRFGLNINRVFDDQLQSREAIANFQKEAKKSSVDNPLWFICAGPMHMPYVLIQSVDKDKRCFINIITHSKWNNVHSKKNCSQSECIYTLEDINRDFPEVAVHEIIDQNSSNGENDFQSHVSNWYWLRDSDNENWRWLYDMDDTSCLKNPKMPETKDLFDISDTGMTYWLITGGPYGGNSRGGSKELRLLFELSKRF